ncbi:MAG: SRPBCC domain-containing protein [Candidatus Aquilonibacter sp.]
MNVTDSANEIVKEITINAPAAKIFAALTEPEQLTQWWGEDGLYHTEHMVVDLRVGGTWRTTGKSASGRPFVVEGEYTAIEPHHLLEYTWRHDWNGGPEQTLVRYELTEHEDGSNVLRVRHSGFTNVQSRDNHSEGWNRVLGWLTNFVE